jgi:deoxyribonuclease-4
MSLHTPYFISLSGVDPEKRLKSIDYIQKSLWAAELLGAETIVIHSGSAAKISRDEAMKLSCDTLEKVIESVGDTDVKLGIETMGKVNQLGTLDEVIEQCKVDRHYVPVVDFGHLNARERGGYFLTVDDYRRIFDKIAEGLSFDVAKNLHCHFSKIEYTDAGEKKHLTFADEMYGPSFEPLMEAIARDGLTPTIICESDGTQPEDALAMKKYYNSIFER